MSAAGVNFVVSRRYYRAYTINPPLKRGLHWWVKPDLNTDPSTAWGGSWIVYLLKSDVVLDLGIRMQGSRNLFHALVPKFASLFGGPPIVLGAPLIFWRPPHQVWGTFFWFGGPPIGIWGHLWGPPNRLGASPSNLGALFWGNRVDLEPPNVKNRMILNDFDRKSYAYTYKFCRNHTILKVLKLKLYLRKQRIPPLD